MTQIHNRAAKLMNNWGNSSGAYAGWLCKPLRWVGYRCWQD